MGAGQGKSVVAHLRVLLLRDTTELSDAQLLEHFVARREEEAFSALVRRHGPLVLGICRRLLGHAQDAEDAFQATFLVLARKAATVQPRERLAAWLHGVAYHAALKLRASNARRRAREREVAAMTEAHAGPPEELLALLDEELGRLPDKYRLPIALCDLQGKTYKDAAQQLGWPEGTLSVRLARARQALAGRLTRRGVTLSAAALTAALARAASAAVPTALLTGTTHAGYLWGTGQALAAGIVSSRAESLAEGVLKAMLLTKLKTWTAGLLVLVLLAMPLGYTALAGGQAEKQGVAGVATLPTGKDAGTPRKDLDALQGVWAANIIEREGKQAPNEVLQRFRVVFKGNRLTIDERTATFTLDPGKKPKWIDVVPDEGPAKGKRLPAIYELDGDTLKLCFDNIGVSDQRPTEFRSTAENRLDLLILRRLQPPQPGKDQTRLQGTWKVMKRENQGESQPPYPLQLVFTGDKVEFRTDTFLQEGTFTLDPRAQPKEIDLRFDGRTQRSIYKFEGDKLILAEEYDKRPADFPTGKDEAQKFVWVSTLERVPAAKEDEAAKLHRTRLRSGSQLHRVMTALHDYHDKHNQFPGPALTDAAGKPLLSWRVALLPFLGEKQLYDAFHLDEPWDSEHNRKLLPRLPKVYASLGKAPRTPHGTFVQAVVGPDCVFEVGRHNHLINDIPDGTSQTIALVLAGEAVPWTKPADVDYSADKPLPSFVGGVLDDGLLSFATADAAVYLMSNVLDEEKERIFRAALTRNGGEVIELEKLR
jgi:RNA polymerase sigma-70 factor (ECF subfamily)